MIARHEAALGQPKSQFAQTLPTHGIAATLVAAREARP